MKYADFKRFFVTRLSKQKFRDNVNISDNLYVDTFDIRDGYLRMYFLVGGEIAWWTSVTYSEVQDLLDKIENVCVDPSISKSVVFKDGRIYISYVSNSVIIKVEFNQSIKNVSGVSMKVDKSIAIKAAVRLSELKKKQGGEDV